MKKNLVYLNIHTVMSVYKITFLENDIASCTEIDNVYFDGRIFYEYNKGLLNFAIVRARSESEARELARDIIDEVVNGEATEA